VGVAETFVIRKDLSIEGSVLLSYYLLLVLVRLVWVRGKEEWQQHTRFYTGNTQKPCCLAEQY